MPLKNPLLLRLVNVLQGLDWSPLEDVLLNARYDLLKICCLPPLVPNRSRMPGVTLHQSRFYRFPERNSATTNQSAPRTVLHRILPHLLSGRDEAPLQLRPRILNHRFPFGSGSRKHPTARVFRTYVARVVQFRCVVWRVLACVAHPQLCALPL